MKFISTRGHVISSVAIIISQHSKVGVELAISSLLAGHVVGSRSIERKEKSLIW